VNQFGGSKEFVRKLHEKMVSKLHADGFDYYPEECDLNETLTIEGYNLPIKPIEVLISFLLWQIQYLVTKQQEKIGQRPVAHSRNKLSLCHGDIGRKL